MQHKEYESLGFATDSPTKLLAKAVSSGNVRGLQKVPGFDLIGAFTDPSGARLALVRRKGHELIATAALASDQTQRAAVYRITDQLAHASIMLDDDSIELLVNVDDPTQYPMRTDRDPDSFALISALALGAVCLRADVYRDEEDFLANRPDDDQPWSSRTLASPGLTAEGVLDATELTARALLGFTVRTAWLRTNELTGGEFWYGVGDSVVPIAFAMPARHTLLPGNVVLGTFLLSASSGLWER